MSDEPGPHPLPPVNFAERHLPITHLRPPWFRCHSNHREAIYFGRSGNQRFNDPHNEFGVLYLGHDGECAFIEVFGRDLGLQQIHNAFLRQKMLSIVSATRSLAVVDLTGPGLAHIGADARLIAGDHHIAQQWSRAFFDHLSLPDGILYRDRHDPSRQAIALFERSDLEVWSTPLGFDVLGRVLSTYRIALMP